MDGKRGVKRWMAVDRRRKFAADSLSTSSFVICPLARTNNFHPVFTTLDCGQGESCGGSGPGKLDCIGL